MGEMFCFQSKFFKHDTCKSWRGLQDEKHLCDITVACEDKQIDAHKVVLSSSSSVFRNLIKQNPHPHPLIYLRGVKYSELVHMLSFMYQGEVNIPQEELQDFLDVGQDLKLAGMSQGELAGVSQQEEEPEEQNIRSRGANIKIEPTQIGGSIDEEEHEEDEDESDPDDNPAADDYMIVQQGSPEETLDHYKAQSYEKGGVDFFYCDKCDYESFKIADLKRHVAAKHKKDRFPCNQCDYKTSTKYFLKRHAKRHTDSPGQPKGKLPVYACDYCDYTSSRNFNLQKHVKCMHKDKAHIEAEQMDESNTVLIQEVDLVEIDESNSNVVTYDDVEYSAPGHQVIAQSSRPSVQSPSGLEFY